MPKKKGPENKNNNRRKLDLFTSDKDLDTLKNLAKKRMLVEFERAGKKYVENGQKKLESMKYTVEELKKIGFKPKGNPNKKELKIQLENYLGKFFIIDKPDYTIEELRMIGQKVIVAENASRMRNAVKQTKNGMKGIMRDSKIEVELPGIGETLKEITPRITKSGEENTGLGKLMRRNLEQGLLVLERGVGPIGVFDLFKRAGGILLPPEWEQIDRRIKGFLLDNKFVEKRKITSGGRDVIDVFEVTSAGLRWFEKKYPKMISARRGNK